MALFWVLSPFLLSNSDAAVTRTHPHTVVELIGTSSGPPLSLDHEQGDGVMKFKTIILALVLAAWGGIAFAAGGGGAAGGSSAGSSGSGSSSGSTSSPNGTAATGNTGTGSTTGMGTGAPSSTTTWSKRGQPEQQRLQPRGYAHQPGHALGEYGAALLIHHSP
jgi:hypothetical protein